MKQSIDTTLSALAHPLRRQIIDYVSNNPGANNGMICEQFEVSRIAISKHIKVLDKANLLAIEESGRERLHYFNVLPIQEIYDRWTDEYSQFFAKKMMAFKLDIESNSKKNNEDSHEKTA